MPRSPLAELTAARGRVESRYRGQRVLRGLYDTTMAVRNDPDGAVLSQRLGPGEQCEVVLKVPYLALDSRPERPPRGLASTRHRGRVLLQGQGLCWLDTGGSPGGEVGSQGCNGQQDAPCP